MIPTSGAWLFSQPQKGWRAQHWSGFDAPHPPKHRRKAVPQFREVVLVTFQFITWRCPKMGGPPNHPKLVNFSIETHGFRDPQF